MAKQANRMMIGGFVVIAIFILAASLVVFGSGRFFKKTETFVLYFDGSVKGLSVGAPVLFQGVQIGSVKSIIIRAESGKNRVQIPVTIEVEPSKFEVGEDMHALRRGAEESLPQLIDMGLRAVLTMQSFITGQLMIEIDFHPGAPLVLRDVEKEHLEIPTIQSTTERLAQSLQKLDVDGLQENLKSTLEGIDGLVNDPNLKAAIYSLKEMLSDMKQMLAKVDAHIDPLADNLDGTLRDARRLVNNVDRQVDPLAENVNRAVRDFDRLARSADARVKTMTASLNNTMASAKGVLSEDAPLIVELENTLQEVSAMARAFRQLANYLEQHPEALIQGKSRGGKK